MNKKEIGIVIAVTILIIVTSLSVAFLTSGRSPIKGKSTQKRFSASPGKTRDNPLLLVSKKREDTFGQTEAEEKKNEETAQINKVYSSQLGENGEEMSIDTSSKKIEGENIKEGTSQTDIPDELKQLLQSGANGEQIPKDNIEERLNQWANSVQSQEKKLEVIKNHLDSLISKGLTEWVEVKLKEIIEQKTDDKSTLSEAQWLLAQVKSNQGDITTAEQYYQEAWENISSMPNLTTPKQEEILRLLGLNYVQFLRKQNKNGEAEKIINTVSEKLKAKIVVKE